MASISQPSATEMITPQQQRLIRLGFSLGQFDIVCSKDWVETYTRNIDCRERWAKLTGELSRHFAEMPMGIEQLRRIIDECFADFQNQAEAGGLARFFQRMRMRLGSIGSEVEVELSESECNWFQFGRALGKSQLGLPELRSEVYGNPRDFILSARRVWEFVDSTDLNSLAGRLSSAVAQRLKALRSDLDDFAQDCDIPISVPMNDSVRDGWNIIENWISALVPSSHAPSMTKYLPPSEWRRWLENNNRPSSETSWGKFKVAHEGEDHPIGGSRLVRFPVTNLFKDGLQPHPQWIDDSP